MKIRSLSYVGWSLLTILTVVPVVLWLTGEPLSNRFATPYMTYASLGEATGIIALVLFCLNIVLSTRLKIVEDLFDGLNKLYLAHQLTGGLAICIVLLHPILLALRSLTVSLHDAALLLLPFTGDLGITFGVLALWLFMLLICLTLYMRLPYRIWLVSHRFMGLVLLLIALHILLTTESELSNIPTLFWYCWVMVGLAAMAYMYRSIFPQLFVKRYRYKITTVFASPEKGVARFIMTPVKRPLRFTPGQFIFASFRAAGLSHEWHPYSISSSNENDPLAFTVKNLGEYTSTLVQKGKNLIGTEVIIEGAYGHFSFQRFMRHHQIWIAGGIGVTPFLSMVPTVPAGYRIDFYYSVRTANEIIDWVLLQTVTQRSGGVVRLIPYITEKYGHLTASEVVRLSGDLSDAEILICGPTGMMHTLQNQFHHLGIKKRFIHSEEFSMS